MDINNNLYLYNAMVYKVSSYFMMMQNPANTFFFFFLRESEMGEKRGRGTTFKTTTQPLRVRYKVVRTKQAPDGGRFDSQ